MRLRHIAVALAVVVAGRLDAQNGPAQDSTLIGIHLVQLNVVAPAEAGPVRESMALELRKAGLRVLAPDSARAGAPVDAIITVILRDVASCSKELRMNVTQRVQVLRTGRFHQLATWLYEIPPGGVRGGNMCRREYWSDAIKQAGDVFLTKWLDVNGR